MGFCPFHRYTHMTVCFHQQQKLLSQFENTHCSITLCREPLGFSPMDELYSLHSSISSCPLDSNYSILGDEGRLSDDHRDMVLTVGTGLEMSDVIKSQIANHPLYPNLLNAYIACRKVGAPPEVASVLEEISKENHQISTATEIGTDPELDDFMRSYCEALHKYKEELSKPFDEATNFLTSIESQLSDLCKETLPSSSANYSYQSAEDGGCPSEEDLSSGEVLEGSGSQEQSSGSRQGDQELKEMLMRKYSGYLSSLRKEFLKKRKKGKLPKGAISALLDWWNTHYRWPYPTEEEKKRLSEMTGLDQKQINNWFINQRKRHWRPSEDMRFALMEGVADAGSMYVDGTGGTIGI